MLCEMNIDRVLQAWVAPKIREMINELEVVDLDDPNSVITALNRYTSGFTVEEATGDLQAWTWSSYGGPNEVHALNQALKVGSVPIMINPFFGTKLRDWPDDLTAVDRSDPFWRMMSQAEQVGGEHDEDCVEVPIDITSVEWILDTNAPEMLRRFATICTM